MTTETVTLFWFRRDFRLEDNASLFHALQGPCPVQPVFIFDVDILDKLPQKDARVAFIHEEVSRLSRELEAMGSSLDIRIGRPSEVWENLVTSYNVQEVWANRDYEPYARTRDKFIFEFLATKKIPFKAKKDHVVFEKDEVLKKDGKPYTVYTPYSRIWKAQLTEDHLKSYPSETSDNWHQSEPLPIPTLSEIGFEAPEFDYPDRTANPKVIKTYDETRDIPSVRGTSRLSLHLRFGTISIRKLAREAKSLNEKYLNELIWRDFYQAILWHFPHVVDENFNRKYDGVQWRNDEAEFEKWKKGKTGYPIVDAGMRELNATGFMHNRVRMIVASFLTKHLLIDWRWGEAYFAEKLLDFELASNNGGWQWAAGTGVDAQPYFRIFNPYSQTDKYDKDQKYIRKWIPELDTTHYPKPIVDHKFARERCLEVYKSGMA